MRLHMDHIGEMAVVECQGKIVRSEAAFRLRDAVTSQRDARVIVLDLSEVYAWEVPVWRSSYSCAAGPPNTIFSSSYSIPLGSCGIGLS